VVLVELASDDASELEHRLSALHSVLKRKGLPNRVLKSEAEADKYWVVRRESFNLLRSKVKDKKATPFIDDFDVKPEYLPQFLPELYSLLKKHGIPPNLAGHAGSGNFHIIPLLDLSKKSVRDKIPVVEEEFVRLVLKYHGTITAEHNDGLIRTPYLPAMFGEEVVKLFEEVKRIFDPDNIFNPGKKVRGDLAYAMSHINVDR